MYRLVVTLENRETVFTGVPLRDYKQAMTQVAAAVRYCASAGVMAATGIMHAKAPELMQQLQQYQSSRP